MIDTCNLIFLMGRVRKDQIVTSLPFEDAGVYVNPKPCLLTGFGSYGPATEGLAGDGAIRLEKGGL